MFKCMCEQKDKTVPVFHFTPLCSLQGIPLSLLRGGVGGESLLKKPFYGEVFM